MSEAKPAQAIAKVPPPPRAPRGLTAAVSALVAPTAVSTVEPVSEAPRPSLALPDNMSKPNSGLQDLNFKVEPELHRAFKVVASLRGMSMKDLMEASFRCWLEQYGDEHMRLLLPRKPNGAI